MRFFVLFFTDIDWNIDKYIGSINNNLHMRLIIMFLLKIIYKINFCHITKIEASL